MSHKRKISFADLETTFRRGAGPTYPPQTAAQPPQLSQAQQQQQALEDRRRREAAQRLSRKPTDRNLPDDLTPVVIGDGVARYRKLRDVERKLDAVMMQKRLDISEGMSSQMKSEGTLRIWVSNTVEGQPWQIMDEAGSGMGEDGTFDFADSSQASYRVKIQGKLLEDPSDETGKTTEEETKDGDAMDHDNAQAQSKPKLRTQERTKLSHFFKSISIEFERAPALQPDGFSSIEWKKPPPNPQNPASVDAEANFDCLEFERKGDEEMNVTINLVRDEAPDRYKLSKPLSDLLDVEEADRATVVAGIWEYVRAMRLQEDDEHRKFICDERLRAVFGNPTLFFPYVPELIQAHLTPLPPIKLSYTIRMDKPYISPPPESSTGPSQATIYDLRVPLPSPLKRTMQTLHQSHTHIQNLKAITAIDDDIALMVQKMNHENARRKFYDGLARDPARFIKRWVGSQQRDLETILAEGGRGAGDEGYAGEEFRKGGERGVWGQQLARESVGLWLAKQKS